MNLAVYVTYALNARFAGSDTRGETAFRFTPIVLSIGLGMGHGAIGHPHALDDLVWDA